MNLILEKTNKIAILNLLITKKKITRNELAEILGISVGHSYKIIRSLNKELDKKGYLTIAGKLPRKYFYDKYYGQQA